MTVIQKHMFKKAVFILFELIESKKERSIINATEVVKYINERIKGRNKMTQLQVGHLHRTQFSYLVFKRIDANMPHQDYIYVKRSPEMITQQMRGYRMGKP